MNLPNAVMMYPNPATTKVSITASEGIKAITILTLAGKQVLSKNVDNKQSETVPIGLLPKGLYNVRVTTARNTCNNLLYITA